MDVSVTEFKRRCLEIIRRVEESGEPVNITRRGKVVAQLRPSSQVSPGANKPWERLRAMGGKLLARPDRRFTSEDLQRALFPMDPPKARTAEEMKAGIRRHMKTRL